MNKVFAIALAAAVVVGGTSAASARGGCGPDGHRGPYGHCRPNRGEVVVVRPAVGVFYPGRGYWDGRRYYMHRERHHGGWRYR